jgi:hypothetical protein
MVRAHIQCIMCTDYVTVWQVCEVWFYIKHTGVGAFRFFLLIIVKIWELKCEKKQIFIKDMSEISLLWWKGCQQVGKPHNNG